jgi:glucose/arabinose dehydrogenase
MYPIVASCPRYDFRLETVERRCPSEFRRGTTRHDFNQPSPPCGNRSSSRFPLVAALILGLCGTADAANSPNQLTESEKRAGWKLLFDGKTTNGWRNYRSDKVAAGWQIRDEALTRATDGAGDLMTIDQFDNFELSIEYRISPGGNSGIFFHVTEESEEAWHSGPEIQILDNQRAHESQKSGWLYGLYKAQKPAWLAMFEKPVGATSPEHVDATRPAGNWNHVYLRVGEQCEVVVNGIGYYYFRKGDEEWNERVAKSKFAPYPPFGKSPTGHILVQDHGNEVSFRNIKIRVLDPDDSVSDPVDGKLPVRAEIAFPKLQWNSWSPADEQGRLSSLRLMELTHSGDGSNRLFAVVQRGLIEVFLNDPEVMESQTFLDLRERIPAWYQERSDDECGLLGLAFHPNYARNGQLFVYYNSRKSPTTSVISRFRVSPEDPNRADPASEEVLLEIPQMFANHNGGSIEFGPDGYLYIGLGDGGSRNDPGKNGQDLTTWLGNILRIDVDHRAGGKPYAIPAKNPFLDRPGALPEIYAYGFRNVWRIAFDRQTGMLWAADVGQNLWEEINVVQSGGNYGWSRREGVHAFGTDMSAPQDPPIDPVWEYGHRVGVSVTGGRVYRGRRVSALNGWYLYGDYIAGKVWALNYDQTQGRVQSNQSVATIGRPIVAFGEDEQGEVYVLVESPNGRAIYRLVPDNTAER